VKKSCRLPRRPPRKGDPQQFVDFCRQDRCKLRPSRQCCSSEAWRQRYRCESLVRCAESPKCAASGGAPSSGRHPAPEAARQGASHAVFSGSLPRTRKRCLRSHERVRRMRGFRFPEHSRALLSSVPPDPAVLPLMRHGLLASLYRKQFSDAS
jgi:hypothetical protein